MLRLRFTDLVVLVFVMFSHRMCSGSCTAYISWRSLVEVSMLVS